MKPTSVLTIALALLAAARGRRTRRSVTHGGRRGWDAGIFSRMIAGRSRQPPRTLTTWSCASFRHPGIAASA